MTSYLGFYFLLILPLPLVSTMNEDFPNCLSGWKRLGNTCYKGFYSKENWTTANSNCKTFKGRLATIHTEEENQFIGNFTTEHRSTWIGMFRCRDKEFFWTDGSTVSGDVAAWRKGEPNNVKNSENCVEIGPKPNYTTKWNDNSCSISLSYVCSRDLPTPTQVSQIIHINYSSVTLLWDKPSCSDPQVTQYFVTYKADNAESFTALALPSHVTQVQLSGLQMGTKYVIRIKAGNTAGNSSLGTETSFSTRQLTGSAPKIIELNKYRILEKGDNKVKLIALCTVSGAAPFQFDWLIDNKTIKSTYNISQHSNKFVVSENGEQNLGKITCRVTTTQGVDSADVTVLESDVEELSVMKLETFYLTLGLLLMLAAVLIITLALIAFRQKKKFPHIKAASLKLKAERHKDYTYPPTVELRQVNRAEQENECSNQANTGYYKSLKRDKDGKLVGGNSDTNAMEDNDPNYSNVEYPDGVQFDYPSNDVMFPTESDQSDWFPPRNEERPLEKEEYLPGNEGYSPENQMYTANNHNFDDSYQGLHQSEGSAGSYERLVNSGRHNYPGDCESPIYENCMENNQTEENTELPIYSN